MKKNSFGIYKVLLITLITSLSITGISFLDNEIWNLIMLIIGMTAYSIVSLLYSIHAIYGRNAGKEAFAAIFIILLVIGYCVYQGIIKLQQWILSWSITVKILVISIIIILIIGTICMMVYLKNAKKTNKK